MKCPVDGRDLQMMERQGVEIDYCPECRGVWLDRGELDKIIDRSQGQVAPPRGGEPSRGGDAYGSHGHKDRRKKSFLSELFD